MKLTDIPLKLPVPFANTGTKNTIPVPSQIGITDGRASLTDGFVPLNFTQLSAGGVPPFGADFNGILNEITAINRWQNAGGFYPYDSTFSTAIGGYPKGAVLLNATSDGYWRSIADDNTTNPDNSATSANWIAFSLDGVSTFSSLSSTFGYPGQIVKTKAYSSQAGVGVGDFECIAGTATADLGTQISAANSGFFWQRINFNMLTPYDFGVPKNALTDIRAAMQNAINICAAAGIKLRIPNQKYYLQLTANDQYGVSFPTNSNVIFEKGASFELMPYAAYDNYQVIAIYDADNVNVEGAVANGRRDLRTPNAVATGSVTAGVMTITAVTSGTFAVGQEITGTNVLPGTFISSFGTGTGGTGTYNLNFSQTVASTTLSSYSGEYGMGISIRGSTNVTLINPVTNNCYGDGIYGGQSVGAGLTYNKDVVIYNHKADNCRRQGVSLVSYKNWQMYSPHWTNIGNRAPSAGLDIEPNSNTCFLEGARIVNPVTENCFGFGIQVDIQLIMTGSTTAKNIDIEITGHRDIGSNAAFSVANCNTSSGANLISGRILHDSGYSESAKNSAYSASHWDYRGPRVDIIRPVARNPNRNGQTSPTTGSPFSVYRNNAGLNYTIGNVRIIEPTVILESGTIPKNYFFDNTLNDGDESNNAFIDPILLAASTNSNTMYRGVVSNKYRQGLRQSVGSETITGDNAGLGILTSAGSAATYTFSPTLIFVNGPDIYIESGSDAFGATVTPPLGGNFIGKAVNASYSIGANNVGAYLKIKPLGLKQRAAFTGSISTTVLTVSAVSSGALAVGQAIQTVSGAGVAVNTIIISLGTGVGGTGTYNIGISQTVASTSMTSSAHVLNVVENCTGWA